MVSRATRVLAVLGLVIGTYAVLPHVVQAHATLAKCTVAAGAHLTATPKTITCTFVEGVNPQGSFIGVFQATGDKGEVDSQNSAVSFSNAMQMTVSVPALAKGSYNLLWVTISANDGHHAGGYVPFTIK